MKSPAAIVPVKADAGFDVNVNDARFIADVAVDVPASDRFSAPETVGAVNDELPPIVDAAVQIAILSTAAEPLGIV